MALDAESFDLLLSTVQRFVRERLVPAENHLEEHNEVPAELVEDMQEMGLFGLTVPEEFGGANLDYVTLALVLEEIAAGDGGTSTVISVTNCPVNAILMKYGNAQQQKQWLEPLAQGQMLGAFCLTEPHVGSDASSLRTTAVRPPGDALPASGWTAAPPSDTVAGLASAGACRHVREPPPTRCRRGQPACRPLL